MQVRNLVAILLALALLATGALTLARRAIGQESSIAEYTAVVAVQEPGGAFAVGHVFTVTISAAQIDIPLSAFQFDVTHDPGLLAFRYATGGPFLAANGRERICPHVETTPGVVRFACTAAGEGVGATGAGAMATLTFEALATGSGNLVLSDVQLVDGNRPPQLVPVATQDATLTIVASVLPPDVTIASSGQDVVLNWDSDVVFQANGYAVYRSPNPYFLPEDGSATVIASGFSSQATDAGVLTTPGSNYYLVVGEDGVGAHHLSNRTGAVVYEIAPGS